MTDIFNDSLNDQRDPDDVADDVMRRRDGPPNLGDPDFDESMAPDPPVDDIWAKPMTEAEFTEALRRAVDGLLPVPSADDIMRFMEGAFGPVDPMEGETLSVPHEGAGIDWFQLEEEIDQNDPPSEVTWTKMVDAGDPTSQRLLPIGLSTYLEDLAAMMDRYDLSVDDAVKIVESWYLRVGKEM